MQVTIPDSTVTKLFDGDPNALAVWFQNLQTAADIMLYPLQKCLGVADPTATPMANEFMLERATASTAPTNLVVSVPVLRSMTWYAYQTSGGSVTIQCGQWSTLPAPVMATTQT